MLNAALCAIVDAPTQFKVGLAKCIHLLRFLEELCVRDSRPLRVSRHSLAEAGAADAQERQCPGGRTRIVCGEAARLQNWPGQAAFRLHSDAANVSRYFCGGTAIADRWVLTAAHCMQDYISELTGSLRDSKGKWHKGKLEVVLGSGDLTTTAPQGIVPIERIVVHERYRQAFGQPVREP